MRRSLDPLHIRCANMYCRVVLAAFVTLLVVHQDGGQASAFLCKTRKTVPVKMGQLSGSPWYLAAMVDALPEERHEHCVKTEYVYNPESDEFINFRCGMPDGANGAMVSTVTDVYNATSGVFEMIPRSKVGTVVKVSFMQFTLNESFVTAHCEVRQGKLYTDRVVVAFKTRNVDPQKIRQKLQEVGITNFTNEWIIPQINCKN